MKLSGWASCAALLWGVSAGCSGEPTQTTSGASIGNGGAGGGATGGNGGTAAKCGDGTLDAGEFCDDGNVDDGDGCSSACTSEDFVRTDEDDPLLSVEQGLNGPAIEAQCNNATKVQAYAANSDLFLKVCAIAFNDKTGTDKTQMSKVLDGVQSYLDVVNSRIRLNVLDIQTTEDVIIPGQNLTNIVGSKQLNAVAKAVASIFNKKCDAYFLAVNSLAMGDNGTGLKPQGGTATPLGSEVPVAVVTHKTLLDKGAARWAAHELLHVMGLNHLNVEDHCADTPPTKGCAEKCLSVPCNPLESSVVTSNVMSYYDCLPNYLLKTALTKDQVLRARCFLENTLGSTDCAVPKLSDPKTSASFPPGTPITFSWTSADVSKPFVLELTRPDGTTKTYAAGTKTSYTAPATEFTQEGAYIWTVDPTSMGRCESTPRNFTVMSIPCDGVKPGDFQQEPCGNCGTRLRKCGANGTFEPWGACQGSGACATGEKKTCTDFTEAICLDNCTWNKTCKFATVLDPPTLLSPKDFSINLPATTTLDWSDVSEATSYQLQVAPTAAGLSAGNTNDCPACSINQTVTGSTFTVPAGLLADGTNYHWHVRGAGMDKVGLWSASWQFTTSAPLVISDVQVGDSHSCARKSDNTLFCWGNDNKHGNLGIGMDVITQPTPSQVKSADGTSFLQDVKQVSLGHQHTCALIGPMNDVYCWGGNTTGELGLGDTTNRYFPAKVGLSGVTQIRAGNRYTCASKQGIIYCWGQVPGTSGKGLNLKVPVDMSQVDGGFTNADAVSVGESHGCLLKGTGVYCWGENLYGQLGTGTFNTFATQLTPSLVNSLSGGALAVLQLPTHQGYSHTCVDSALNQPFCWGTDAASQVGGKGNSTCFGNTVCATKPQAIPVTEVAEVQVGEDFSCARNKSGEVWCWGTNIGSTSATPVAVKLKSGTNLVSLQLAAGSGSHACALDTKRQVLCWGHNYHGQLGDGTNVARSYADIVKGL